MLTHNPFACDTLFYLWCQALVACSKAGQWQQCLELLEKDMHVSSFNIAINACRNADMGQAALNLISEADRKQVDSGRRVINFCPTILLDNNHHWKG